MKKTLLYSLAAAFAISGVAETAPVLAADGGRSAPPSLDELRASVRADAMMRLALGEVDRVGHTRYHRHRYAPRRRVVPRRFTLRYIHRPGRSCRRWVGRRCYYTPRPLRPFRQR
ncbi:hypothetical protein [Hansschlegelia zhihuaiae]|uniref:Uncharacterized protein n=1 Tax=Hansschlegelia zhihuaiae TaxID=405005 RepID=A0A4Q0MIT0_9HYPH|nr:hypothetical protein [Hansschlegelia zhihuaiae]RXF73577.1 hypothetical protein EK403_10340 [Hansschlegelia zhihuaiae]